MKNKIQIHALSLAVATLSLLTLPALADESTNSVNPGSARLAPDMLEHLGHTTKVSELLGQNIKNDQSVNLGKVKDLAVDVAAGRIVYVIVSAGGVMGIGSTTCAVPPGALHQDVTNYDALQLDVGQDQLEASKFDLSRLTESCGTNQIMDIYARFGQEPYFLLNHATDTNFMTPRQLDELGHGQPMATSDTRLGYVERASKVIGLPVSNFQDEKIGKVQDLIVDLPAGRIVAVVISSGDYLGTNDELSAVPATVFRFNSETNGLQLDVTKETLMNAPHFSDSQWPAVDATYTTTLYHAYSVPTYFNTNSWGDADNTARNVRDRNGGTLTPLDQGTSESDIHITAQIRRQIMARDGLSFTAQNVKIITQNGRVTLRGPVENPEEKRQIHEIAVNIAGADYVDDQIEVKSSASNP